MITKNPIKYRNLTYFEMIEGKVVSADFKMFVLLQKI